MATAVRSIFGRCFAQHLVLLSLVAAVHQLVTGATTGGGKALSQSGRRTRSPIEAPPAYLSQAGGGAPFRYQQEEPPNADAVRGAENIHINTEEGNELPAALDESNLNAIEVVQEADKAWETLLNQKILLESIESSFPEDHKIQLTQTISEGLSNVSSISDSLSQKLATVDEPYKDEEHQDELRADYSEIKGWTEVSRNIQYILSDPSAYSESLLKPGSEAPPPLVWPPPSGSREATAEEDTYDEDYTDEIALPAIVPGSGVLSSSNLDEANPVEANLIRMDQEGLDMQRLPQEEPSGGSQGSFLNAYEETTASPPQEDEATSSPRNGPPRNGPPRNGPPRNGERPPPQEEEGPAAAAHEEIVPLSEIPMFEGDLLLIEEQLPEEQLPEKQIFEEQLSEDAFEFLNDSIHQYITTNAPARGNQAAAAATEEEFPERTEFPLDLSNLDEELISIEDSFLSNMAENSLLQFDDEEVSVLPKEPPEQSEAFLSSGNSSSSASPPAEYKDADPYEVRNPVVSSASTQSGKETSNGAASRSVAAAAAVLAVLSFICTAL